MRFRSDRRRAVLGAGATAGAVLLPGAKARAQSWPSGTIRMVIGYAVGGGSDVLARLIADRLRERLGVNVLVENRPGASGMLGPVAMKGAPVDGSVILFAPTSSTVEQKVSKKSIPFDLDRDLVAVSLAGTVGTVYCVTSSIGVSSLAEYADWVRRNPDKAHFGTAAMGSTTHFFGTELGDALGLKLQPIAYKGTGPLLTDIVAGHVPAGCGGLTSFLQHHRSGKVRILASSTARRAMGAPDLPTVVELGFPKLVAEGFYAFYLPAGAPAAVVDAWNRELRATLAVPALQGRLVELGLEVQSSTPAELLERQHRAIAAFAASRKAAGYEPE